VFPSALIAAESSLNIVGTRAEERFTLPEAADSPRKRLVDIMGQLKIGPTVCPF
jgi:hypothetical protein